MEVVSNDSPRGLPTAARQVAANVDAHGGSVHFERIDKETWRLDLRVPNRPFVVLWFRAPPRFGHFFWWRLRVKPFPESYEYQGVSTTKRFTNVRVDVPMPFGEHDPDGDILDHI